MKKLNLIFFFIFSVGVISYYSTDNSMQILKNNINNDPYSIEYSNGYGYKLSKHNSPKGLKVDGWVPRIGKAVNLPPSESNSVNPTTLKPTCGGFTMSGACIF